MIHLLCPGSCDAAPIVVAALQRSVGHRQVERISPAQWCKQLDQPQPSILVVVNPLEAWSALVIRTLQAATTKVIIFGALPSTLAQYLGASIEPINEGHRLAAQCLPAPTGHFAESALRVEYTPCNTLLHSPLPSRPFLRYDFTDEWNNLGYGALRVDETIWSLAQNVRLPEAHCLAQITLEGDVVGAYAGFWPGDSHGSVGVNSCLLWFNRSVGPVDSPEWRIVELYLAHHAWPVRLCQPVLVEIPHGFDAAVTMRLDCDEDVESARSLWQTYRQLGVPFSLALHAKVLADAKHHDLPRELLAQGGAILSHTDTHAPDWGGSYDAALQEGTLSAMKIAAVTGQQVRFAVSPFHQTPDYARAALADAGYAGCIGGIIRNDPDFLMARSGVAPGSPTGFIGHSQQCMLHGDCMVHGDDPLVIFKQAFQLAQKSNTFFGYLDHPFSERYQYGWISEEQRIQMHIDFVDFMRQSGNVLFANESDALDFLLERSGIDVIRTDTGFHLKMPESTRNVWQHSIEYAGQTHVLPPGGLIL